MLSPRVQMNLRNAKDYFREHLCAGEYYLDGHELAGEWFGFGAETLGLKAGVAEKPFIALCEGRHPHTGEWLTQRQNTKRLENGRAVANRRVFYDFTISPPKSVSVVGLYQDKRIIEMHSQAIRSALTELETFAQTHVRRDAQNVDRITGNVLGAAFLHETSRELDPHLHSHCIVMNATYDKVEERWKALEVSGMYRAQKFVENVYYHELSKGLISLGYELEPSKNGFEIKGVPSSVLQRFSKRHEQIENETRKRLSTETTQSEIMDLRERIAHDGRRAKTKHATAEKLRPYWGSQLTIEEQRALSVLRNLCSPAVKPADASKIVAWADQHLFERRSIVHEHELLSTALMHARGQSVDLTALKKAVMDRSYLRERRTNRLTSREVLDCEIEIIRAAKEGKNSRAPLNPTYKGASALSDEQRTAVNYILRSPDFITLFRGAAGTGKSFALREVYRGIAATGRHVLVLAPQRQQVIDLEKEGLPTQTLAHVLATYQLPSRAVIIVDEAGQVGGKQLRTLIRLAKEHRGQLILSGDTRQHGAITASDALRAIEKHSGLKSAEIRTIRRQNAALGRSDSERAFIRYYREAVASAAHGDVLNSFDQLDRLGCVRELPILERRRALTQEYVVAREQNETALVVAQTWNEVNAMNEAIREHLKNLGKLGNGTFVTAYRSVDATGAEKQDRRLYESKSHVYFLQRYGRYKKGDLCEIVGANERGVVLVKDGRRSTLSYRHAHRMAVVDRVEMQVSPGDRLQLKFNGKSKEGEPLTNGEIVTFKSLHSDGSISVVSDRGERKTILPSQRLFNYGYAVTSYASQGKTVDRIFFADSSIVAATSSNQWYVAISRGRKSVAIYTSDKNALRANIARSGIRELAVELNSPGNFSSQLSGNNQMLDTILHTKSRSIIKRSLNSELTHKASV